jgi:hypothetical protein
MTLNEYFKTTFADDLAKMNFLPVPDRCLECSSLKASTYQICNKGVDKYTVFFGGKEWENINQDIKYITKENLEYFFICLFTIITIDTGIYTYYQKYYHQFREKTLYPKFGGFRIGFGISAYYVNPRKILEIPESYGFINTGNINRYVDEYVNTFIYECNEFFINNEIEIDTNDFMTDLLTDSQFIPHNNKENNSAFTLIYSKLSEKTNRKLSYQKRDARCQRFI